MSFSEEFNTTLKQQEERLTKYALSLTKNREEAKNLLQETYLKAFAYQDKYTQDSNMRVWLQTITRNTFLNDCRVKLKTKDLFDTLEEIYDLPSRKFGTPNTDEGLFVEEIEKAIESLSDEYKIPLVMKIGGYQAKEIAEELGIPFTKAKNRIFYGRKKVAEKLGWDYEDPNPIYQEAYSDFS